MNTGDIKVKMRRIFEGAILRQDKISLLMANDILSKFPV